MAADRPINADVPAVAPQAPPKAEPPREHPRAAPAPKAEPPQPPRQPRPPKVRRRRRPVPFALKGIGGLVAVAVVFVLAAVLGGSKGGGSGPSGPAPASGGRGGGSQPAAAEAAARLGYPAFATKNTTRVGGADPASTAAGAALAVFPSATAAQRPAAVTLASEDDWQGAIAAAVLMSEPVRAPLLFAGPGGVPGASSEALEALSPRGSEATGGAQAFAIGDVAVPNDLKATAIEASSPSVEAAAIERLRDRLFGSPPQNVMVAPAEDPGIAMPAAAWAARSGDPILYAEGAKLPPATADALKLHPKTPVYVIGPPSAVSPGVLREIAAIDPVHRVGGPDPVTNAIALARYARGGFGWNVNDPGHGFVVARGDAPLDAAAAAPLSASGTWGPLLLTDGPDKVPAALRGYLLDVKPGYTTDPTRAFYNHVWVIGDEEAIGVSQQAEIDSLAELGKIRGEP